MIDGTSDNWKNRRNSRGVCTCVRVVCARECGWKWHGRTGDGRDTGKEIANDYELWYNINNVMHYDNSIYMSIVLSGRRYDKTWDR